VISAVETGMKDALQRQVLGRVLTQNDADYESAKRPWNLAEQQPALVLIAEDEGDIAAGVRLAAAANMPVAVQSTGHGVQYPADGSLLIITSPMTDVQVDAEAKTARISAGAVWHHVLDAATPHGLAPLLGSSPHVGVMGYTLGGGIGWLVRKYGLAADSVRSLDIVTPDGVKRQASADENADLFWAVRGGGGNFGVVTSIDIDLYPVANVYGGMISYSGEMAADVLRFYRDWLAIVPDELTSSIALVKFPHLPMVPKAMRGQTVVMLRAAYVGAAVEGAALIQPWLTWRQPRVNTFASLPFADIGMISNDPTTPTAGFGSNELVNDLSDALIDLIVANVIDPSSPLVMTELRHAGGAIARVATDANAISNRDAQFYMQMGGPTPTEAHYEAMKAHVKDYKAQLRLYVRGGVYLNFMKGEEAQARVQHGYRPEAYARLKRLKAEYDPQNLFRYSYQLV
jgi:FAD/FMN-containing dehydrogenase